MMRITKQIFSQFKETILPSDKAKISAVNNTINKTLTSTPHQKKYLKTGEEGLDDNFQKSIPVASRARIASQNALAFSRRRIKSLAEVGTAESWKILDKRCR